jgi:hypothetical protein
MNKWKSPLYLFPTLILLFGCGGGPSAGNRTSAPPTTPIPKLLEVAGGWQFTTTSTVGMSSSTISGSITQLGNSLTGGAHVQGSNCFDPMASNVLTGTISGNNMSLDLASPDGQLIALTGTVAANVLTGTYAITGGCADGDKGNVSALQVPSITGSLSGTLTPSTGAPIDIDFFLTQGSASSDGSFGVTGNGSLTGACFKAGTIVSGTFPIPSYILGTSLALHIDTGNGTLDFLGTADISGTVTGNYTVVGGTCDQSGTGSLVFSPWDY